MPISLHFSGEAEKAPWLFNSLGLSKTRLHFYPGFEKNKDKYAVYAEKIILKEGQAIPKNNWRFVYHQDGNSNVVYKINKGSLQKRLGITSKELKGVTNHHYENLIQQKLSEKGVQFQQEAPRQEPKQSSRPALNSVIDQPTTPLVEAIPFKECYLAISTAIEKASKDPSFYQAFLNTVEQSASLLKTPRELDIKKHKIIIPGQDLLKNPSDLEGAWIVKAIVCFGGYSIRYSGNSGHYLSLAQTSLYIEELMKREDKIDLIKQIKSELERFHTALKTPTNDITPYSSFVQNLQLIQPEGKKEFLEILKPQQQP